MEWVNEWINIDNQLSKHNITFNDLSIKPYWFQNTKSLEENKYNIIDESEQNTSEPTHSDDTKNKDDSPGLMKTLLLGGAFILMSTFLDWYIIGVLFICLFLIFNL